MITLMDVYDAFLSKVNEDDWARCRTPEDLEWFIRDWRSILNSAIPYFKFPRVDLQNRNDIKGFFIDKLNNEEIKDVAEEKQEIKEETKTPEVKKEKKETKSQLTMSDFFEEFKI